MELDFNAADVPPNEGFDLIEAGEYDAIIVASEDKPTKSGSGKYLKLKIQLLNGKYQNRILFDNLNLWNPSPQAQAIARGQFSAICRAINVLSPRRSEEIHDKPLRVKVGTEKGQDGELRNVIKGYKPRSAGPVSQPTATTSQSASSPW